MENDAATLYCPNEVCQAPNPLTHKFCQRCSTPLPKRYLWAVAERKSVPKPGELLADRYLVISKAVLLDTKPGLSPQTPDVENLQSIRPYLRLFPYRLHVPQVYGVLYITEGHYKQEVLLLEKPPLYIDSTNPSVEVQLGSDLITAWRGATSMRQLNWLWQVAYLWQPLASEGVASSLLIPELIRVEGSLVRLLELRGDQQTSLGLPQLGGFWQQLCKEAKPAIAEFLNNVCHWLISGEIHASEQLVAILDKGLAEVGRWQTPNIKITTKSDTGPSRQRNEDACYPPSGSIISKPPQSTALAIVCDGIGGHEGGNVASNLAIDTIQQQLQDLTNIPVDHINPVTLLTDLEKATAVANDKISQRNDNEHRQGRQRMGTTLVMALPIAHEMYIAHVGDSRAYWITPYGCYQVTLDDDVASREVRLGYATYRDAVQQGASGSLVQALGMSSSSSLHPTSQRFILDEDCVFLLCSDGLSDFDRVEQHWETEILPILTSKIDIKNVTDRLVEIANHQNGHDNVTIALVHCQVKFSEPKSAIKLNLAEISAIPVASASTYRTAQPTLPLNTQTQKTQVVSTGKSPKGFKLPLQLIVIPLLLLGSVAVGYLWRTGWLMLPPITTGSSPTADPTDVVPSTQPSIASSGSPSAKTGTFFITNNDITFRSTTSSLNPAIVPVGSVLQIIDPPESQAVREPSNQWVYLRVCSIGQRVSQLDSQSVPVNDKLVPKPGDKVRIEFSKFNSTKSRNFLPAQSEQASQCQQAQNTTGLPVGEIKDEDDSNGRQTPGVSNQIEGDSNTSGRTKSKNR